MVAGRVFLPPESSQIDTGSVRQSLPKVGADAFTGHRIRKSRFLASNIGEPMSSKRRLLRAMIERRKLLKCEGSGNRCFTGQYT